MVLSGSLGCNIMAPKYALCKHGSSHSRRSCGFAHSLEELELADQPLCHGLDSSSARYGRSGVDLFYGQCYSASQLLRVLMYVTQASQLPLWARMVLWYYRILPASAFALDSKRTGFSGSFMFRVCSRKEDLKDDTEHKRPCESP